MIPVCSFISIWTDKAIVEIIASVSGQEKTRKIVTY